MIGEIVVLGGQQRSDEVLGDVIEGDRGAAHFSELCDQLGIAAVDTQRDL